MSALRCDACGLESLGRAPDRMPGGWTSFFRNSQYGPGGRYHGLCPRCSGEMPDEQIHEGECGTAREAPTTALSGAVSSSLAGSPLRMPEGVTTPLPAPEPFASHASPAVRAAPPLRKPLIKLPRYGEMEKQYDPVTRRLLDRGTPGNGTR